jgi:hypothetical protein
MAERSRRDKAGELTDDLLRHPLSEEEAAHLKQPIGQLQLRADIPAVDLDDQTMHVQDLLRSRLRVTDIVALAEPNEGTVGVVVPVEQYLRLVRETINAAWKPGFTLPRENLDPWYVQEVSPNNPDAPVEPPRG